VSYASCGDNSLDSIYPVPRHLSAKCFSPLSVPVSYKNCTETLGLCTGLLSAVAVSSSVNKTQLHNYGAVAIRLAMTFGALVNTEDMETKLE
jgi:hypothetical protein